jgi:hypothetical protein
MRQFNEEIPNDERVAYYSYGASLMASTQDFQTRLRNRIAQWGGITTDSDHDGMVEVHSMWWGEECELFTTDHSGIIGMRPLPWKSHSFDHLTFFSKLADTLAKKSHRIS